MAEEEDEQAQAQETAEKDQAPEKEQVAANRCIQQGGRE
jgi:hypothetical protein